MWLETQRKQANYMRKIYRIYGGKINNTILLRKFNLSDFEQVV